MQYSVVLIETKEGIAVSCPALPGCHSQGETREEALVNIREAIALWQEVAEEDAQRPLWTQKMSFGHSAIGYALKTATVSAVTAFGPLKATHSDGAITFAQDQPTSLALGDEMAAKDMIRFTLFTNNVTGELIRGNAVPFGEFYSGFSLHWLTELQNYWGTTDISISVGGGIDRENPDQSSPIIKLETIPGMDFVLATHLVPFSGAKMPEFSLTPLVRNNTVMGVGFGPQQVWGSSTITDNGHAQAVFMRVFNSSNSQSISLSNDSAMAPTGGFINFNSTSVLYSLDQLDQKWKLTGLVQTGTPITPSSPIVLNGALDFVGSGAAQYINTHTPLNVPEPTAASLLLTTAAFAASRRRRNL